MASERQERLAKLVADGIRGTEAFLLAGWPEQAARMLGQNLDLYLAKAGLAPSAPGEPEQAPIVEPVTVVDGDLPFTDLAAEDAPELADNAATEVEPTQPRPRGRPRKAHDE